MLVFFGKEDLFPSIHPLYLQREAEVCPGPPWSCRAGADCQDLPQERSVNELGARRGLWDKDSDHENHHTHGTGSRASTAGLLLQQINIRFIFSHQSWECRKNLGHSRLSSAWATYTEHWARLVLQCISWPGMQNLHFSLTFLGKKINISLNQMLFSTKLKELVRVVLF